MVETAEKIHNDFETTGNNSNENKPDDDTDIVQVDSQTKISKINRTAYVKLHRSSLTGSSANSINRIKNKFEINTTDTELMRAQSEKFQVSASGSVLKNQERFKTSDKQQQDENYNDVCSSDEEIQYIPIVRRQSSTETIDDIKNELNEFITMDPKAKEKKKTNLRRIFSWLGKDKKKNQEESRKYRHSDYVNHDNTKNETNSFNRDSTYRHTIAADTRVNSTNHNVRNKVISNVNNIDKREDEQKFANQHIENFNHIRRSFDKDTDKVKTNKNSVYANTPYISKYIDPNLSTSESDKENPFIEKRSRTRPEPPPRNHYDLTDNKIEVHVNKINNSIPGSSSSSRDTPPRAQETRQNVKLVNPKAYQSTLEAKQEKPTLEETYGTVFDSVENKRSSMSSIPKSPKLKLPPNRDTSPLSPRVTSPLPHNSVSTEKIIATELLKNSRSPTPVRKPSDKGTLPSSHQNLQLEFDYPVPLNENSQIPRKPPRIPTNMNRNSAHNGTMYTNSPTLLRTPTPSNLLRPLSPSANSLRSSTPVDLRLPLSPKSSPQKDEIRKSVEAYYWNEIKKMKEREIIDYNLLYQKKLNMENDLRRSRSLSPNTDRSRRSLSLPRSTQMQYVQGASGNSYIISPDYNNSGRAIVNLRTPSTSQYVNVNPNFIRNSSERRTTDNSQLNYENYNSSLYRPIFRRGSLTKQPPPVVTDQQQQLNKKVSFYGSLTNSNGSWPTKNGYTKSPPQRRPDKLDSPLDDDVFLPNGQRMPPNIVDGNNIYDTHYRNKPNIYMTKSEMLQMRQRNLQDNNNPPVNYSPQGLTRHGSIIVNEPIYTERPYNSRRMSFDSVNFVQQNLPESYQVYRQNDMPQQSNPRRREIIMNDHDIFGQIGGYSKQPPQNEPIYPQPQPYRDTSLYSSKNSLYNTNNRQVNVRNKVCDFYGQIHDNDGSYGEIQKSGMLMGQLQYNPSSPSAVRQNSGQFVRGTRLTASANDMSFYRRQPNIDARYRNNVYPVQYGSRMDESPNRPLPPVPKNKLLFRNVSDTESASDNSEIQRIVNKKRTVFGK